MGDPGVEAPRRWFRVQAIGTVRRPERETAPGEVLDPWAESVLELRPRWAAGLDGLEGFSHLVVLCFRDRAPRRRVAGPPRVPENAPELPPVGFFATRTPRRPNPLGVACPRLLRREGNRLVVAGIDAVPAWLSALWARHDAERGPRG